MEVDRGTLAEITDTSVIAYRDEVIVELIGTDPCGDVSVVAYQFEYGDESDRDLTPKGPIEPPHVPPVEECLDERGYRLHRENGDRRG